MAKMQEAGELFFDINAFVDAKAVFDAITAETVKLTTDKKMYIHTLAAREMLDQGQVSRLYWLDAKDMCTDGMTKGTVDRAALMSLGCDNRWKFIGLEPVSYLRRGRLRTVKEGPI